MTALAVTASTQQAVGAFNALAASVAGAIAQFNALNASMNRGNQGATRFSGSITAINSAFQSLTKIASGAFNVIQTLFGSMLFTFDAIIKQLDKLQGFQAVMSVTTKSADDAAASYDFLRKTADKLGVQFDTLTSNYAKLVASLPAGTKGLQTAEKAFLGVTMAARTLHSTNQETSLMFYAITQIASKGVVSMEELRRQLGEKLPGVMQIASKALNTLPENLEAAIRKGIVSSEKFLPIFGDALIRTFADSSKKASESVSASIARLTNVWVDFVKQILDSGAGDSIVGIFDALREKLSDPYLIERFAQLIKNLAERFTEFITKLTADDIRNGFDTMSQGIEMIVKVVGKLIQGLTWIINNASTAGAILGGVTGAAVGAATAGPIGAAVGLAGGAGLGAYAGSQLAPSASTLQNRASQDVATQASKAMEAQQRELLKFNALIPMLQNFKGLSSLNGLENLFKAENLNTKTLVDLNRILTGPEFKTDKERTQGVRDYAQFGAVVGPQTSQLSDTFTASGNKKPKGSTADPLGDSLRRSQSLDTNVNKELANYLTLLKGGKLTTDQYSDALQKLISKQPYMIAYQRELRDAQSDENQAISEHIGFIMKQVEAKDELGARMQEDLRLASMRGESLQIEGQVLNEVNRLKGVGYDMTQQEIAALREKFKIINDTRELASAEERIIAGTLDKYRQQVVTMQALRNLQVTQPGFGKEQAQDFLVQQDPALFKGTQEYVDAQKRTVKDMYAYVDGLRAQDLISDTTALQMKANAYGQFLTDFGLKATEVAATIQGTLGTSIEMALAGNFRNIGQMWSQMISRMAAQAAASQIMKLIFGGDFMSGGPMGGLAGALIGGVTGKKAMGGDVSGGKLYEVNERNRPEMFSSGGHQYLLPSRSGRVDPVESSSGSKPAPQVTYAPVFNVNAEVSPATVNAIKVVAKNEFTRFVRQLNLEQ